MGKGDKKTKRGKINRGSYGVRRPRIKKQVRPEEKINISKKVKP
tara:strand:- start:43208 stop:43339 length:132 start_codon:yes stop_codon:yes gene_type:complete